jgi:hypothetical protein
MAVPAGFPTRSRNALKRLAICQEPPNSRGLFALSVKTYSILSRYIKKPITILIGSPIPC